MRNRRPLSEVIAELLILRDEGTMDRGMSRAQATLLAKRCIRDFGRYAGGNPKTVIITVDSSGFVPWPTDYLTYTKIGALDGSNKIITLSRNDGINVSLNNMLDAGGNKLLDNDGVELLSKPSPAEKTTIGSTKGGDVYYNYAYQGGVTNVYGTPGGSNSYGHYRTTDDGIELSAGVYKNRIVLEYVPDITMSSNPQVPEHLEEVISTYVYWKYVGKLKVTSTEKMMARKEYFNTRRLAKHKARKVTLYEMVDAGRVNSVKKTVRF